MLRVIDHWNRWSKNVLDSPSLAITQNPAGHSPEQLAVIDMLCAGGLG